MERRQPRLLQELDQETHITSCFGRHLHLQGETSTLLFYFILEKIIRTPNFHSSLIVKMVRVNPNPEPGEGTIWFDYFNVTGVYLPAYSPTPSPSSAVAHKKSKSIGPIIGEVVGGLLFLGLLVYLLLFCRRRKRLSKNVKSPIEPEAQAPGESPCACRSSHFSHFLLQFQSTPSSLFQTQLTKWGPPTGSSSHLPRTKVQMATWLPSSPRPLWSTHQETMARISQLHPRPLHSPVLVNPRIKAEACTLPILIMTRYYMRTGKR